MWINVGELVCSIHVSWCRYRGTCQWRIKRGLHGVGKKKRKNGEFSIPDKQCIVMIGLWLHLDRLLHHDPRLSCGTFLLGLIRSGLYFIFEENSELIQPSPSKNFYMDFYRLLYGRITSAVVVFFFPSKNEDALHISHNAGCDKSESKVCWI